MYISVILILVSIILPSVTYNIDLYMLPPVLEKFRHTDAAEFNELSCCLDALPTALLKKTLAVHLPVLSKIINMSLDKGIFPGRLKTAHVTPNIKKASLDQNELSTCVNLTYTGKLI